MSNITSNVHMAEGDEITGKAHIIRSESLGLYPVVDLTLGSLSITAFPRRPQLNELAELLTRMAAEVRELAAELAPKVEVLTD